MPYDGNGNFVRTYNWQDDATAGIKIRADRHDDEMNDYAEGLSNVICRDGQSSPTANISFNGFKLIALGAPTAPADASTKKYVDDRFTTLIGEENTWAKTQTIENADPKMVFSDTTVAGLTQTVGSVGNVLYLSADDGNIQGSSRIQFHVDGVEIAGVSQDGIFLHNGRLTLGLYNANDYLLWDDVSSTLALWSDASPYGGALQAGKIRLWDTGSATATSTNHPLQLGEDGGSNLRLSPTGLMAVNNGVQSTFTINSPTNFSNSSPVTLGTGGLTTAGNITYTTSPFLIAADANTKEMRLCGGISGAPGTDGSVINLYGATHSGQANNLFLSAGAAGTPGNVHLRVGTASKFTVRNTFNESFQGLYFGQVAVADIDDTSRHLCLWGPAGASGTGTNTFGINVTNNAMNLVVGNTAANKLQITMQGVTRFEFGNTNTWFKLRPNTGLTANITTDDNANRLHIAGGSTGSATGGGVIQLFGLTNATAPGNVNIAAGSSTGDIEFYSNNALRGWVANGGNFVWVAPYATNVDGRDIFNTTGIMRSSRAGTTSTDHQQFANGNGLVGRIRTNASATEFVTSSDARLKTDLKPIDPSIIDRINVYDFAWIADGLRGYGCMAQELYEVVPQAVTKPTEEDLLQTEEGEPSNDVWGADYSKLVPLLIAKVQDLEARLKALEV